jgi:hypothetical protein
MAGYPNLPGTIANLNDLGLRIAPQPAGPKVTLLGVTANWRVPLNEPLSVTNIGQATAAMYGGNSGNDAFPGELSLAIEEASLAGAQNIEVVVVAHVSGSDYTNYTDPTSQAGMKGRYDALSSAYTAIQNLPLDVVSPVNAWADCTGFDFGSQLADFCYQATTEVDNACIGVLPMMTVPQWAWTHRSATVSPLSGTTDTTVRGEISSLSGAAEWYFAFPSLALITEWEKYATQTNSPVVTNLPTWWDAYIAGSEDLDSTFYPLDDENAATDVSTAYFATWQANELDGSRAFDQRGNKVDAGARISVVGCPLRTSTSQIRKLAKGVGASLDQTVQNTDGAAAYAGFITTLPAHSSPTNKRISSLGSLRPLSPAQANRLAGRRIVSMMSRANGFVVVNAVTGAYNVSRYVRSDFVRLTTVRVIDAILDLIREVAQKYVGEPNTAAQRNALANEIDKFLKQMRVVGAHQGASFHISATPEQQVLGEAEINLTIVPPFEILKITTNISLAKSV